MQQWHNPVLINAYQLLSSYKYREAIYLVLSNESLSDDNFKALDHSLNKNITIERTDKTENIIKLNNYKDELAKLSEDQIELFRLHQRNIDIKETEKLIYDFAWK